MENLNELYFDHIEGEGEETWNQHPDGCYHCGSCQHHSQDCQDRELAV